MVRHVSRLAATARNAHYFSRRTPLNFFAAFFAPGFFTDGFAGSLASLCPGGRAEGGLEQKRRYPPRSRKRETRPEPPGLLSDREGRARERRRSILEDGHPEMIFKDLLGNIMEHAAVVALAESVGQGS